MKYEYTYKEPDCVYDGYGLVYGRTMSFDHLEKTINQYAEEGWRYCGWLPLKQRSSGFVEKIKLVFEREKE